MENRDQDGIILCNLESNGFSVPTLPELSIVLNNLNLQRPVTTDDWEIQLVTDSLRWLATIGLAHTLNFQTMIAVRLAGLACHFFDTHHPLDNFISFWKFKFKRS